MNENSEQGRAEVMKRMDWSIQEVARLAGTTSRTLRHYGELGLLPPSRIGSNGYRHYDQHSLARLQRILLLRELGLGLAEIGRVLDGQSDDATALAAHLDWLDAEQERIARQRIAVQTMIASLTEGGEPIMAEEALDGFDHTQYKDEVIQRWGEESYRRSDTWWRGLTAQQRQEFQQESAAVQEGYRRAVEQGDAADSDAVQAVAARHYAWIAAGWGGKMPSAEAFTGLGEMYVADPRFAANYEQTPGDGGAEFVRDAMRVYAERNLVEGRD